MNTPVDPDKLRARLTQAVEPVKPSPDALVRIKAGARKRRRLQWTIGSGAGVVAIAGAAAAVIAVGSLGPPSASPRTVAPGYSPTVTPTATATPTPVQPVPTTTEPVVPLPLSPQPPATATPVATAAVAASVSAAVPTTAVPTTAVTTTTAQPPTSTPSAPVTTTPVPPQVADDVDGDGKADTATVAFSPGIKARLVVHLGSRDVAGPTFMLGDNYGAGHVTLVDVNGDGRSEIIVKGIGATGTPYYLFQYLNGQVVQVPSLEGAPTDPPLYSGGGGIGEGGRFDCVGGRIEDASYQAEGSTVSGAVSARRFDFTMARLTLVNGRLQSQATTQRGLTLQQAQSRWLQHPDGRCGAPL